MARKLGHRSEAFLASVYQEGYNPGAPPAKKPKVEATSKEPKPQVDTSNLDMKALVGSGGLAGLTVPTLKSWLKDQGINVTNKKKAELLDLIHAQF